MEVYIKYDKKGKGVRSKVLNGFIFFVKMCTREGGGEIVGLFQCTYFMDVPKKHKKDRKNSLFFVLQKAIK